MSPKTKAKPILQVVFDTNVLYTKLASDLLVENVKLFIQNNSNHSDLSIEWYLSNIVIDERRYQMRKIAKEFLPSINKLEKLLGHNLNITSDILDHRVDIAINEQLESLNINNFELDTTKIDWNAIINQSCFRLPPFECGETEKGFRDSLIAEAFLQLIENSPSTPSICRLSFITSDKKLYEYLKDNTKDKSNVRILNDISELESLINTLVSQVTEQFISEIIDKVSDLFFNQSESTGLYYSEKIFEEIKNKYGNELESKPIEGLERKNDKIWISNPVFIRKERQRIFWSTPIKIDAKLFKYDINVSLAGASVGAPIPNYNYPQNMGLLGIASSSSGLTFGDLLSGGKRGLTIGEILSGKNKSSMLSTGNVLSQPIDKIDMGKGSSSFEVIWSVNITPTKKLTAPKVEEIKFVSTTWENY